MQEFTEMIAAIVADDQAPGQSIHPHFHFIVIQVILQSAQSTFDIKCFNLL